MKKALLLALGLLSLAGAQGYVQNGPIGQPAAAPTSTGCPTADRAKLPLDCWVGQKIIFLPQSQTLQQYGYLSFRKTQESYPRAPFAYEELAGKTGTVTRIFANSIGTPQIEVKMDGSGVIAYGEAISNNVDGIGFIRDIESARAALIGKPLWLRRTGLGTVDATGGNFGEVKTGRLAKVTVTNVVAGTYGDSSVRIIAKSQDGRTGYVDVAWSATNVSPILADVMSFERSFFAVNPRTLYTFPEAHWKAIEAGQIIVGMNAQAAVLAWNREPDDINTTTAQGVKREQWVYEGGKYGKDKYVTLENGIVTSVQE